MFGCLSSGVVLGTQGGGDGFPDYLLLDGGLNVTIDTSDTIVGESLTDFLGDVAAKTEPIQGDLTAFLGDMAAKTQHPPPGPPPRAAQPHPHAQAFHQQEHPKTIPRAAPRRPRGASLSSTPTSPTRPGQDPQHLASPEPHARARLHAHTTSPHVNHDFTALGERLRRQSLSSLTSSLPEADSHANAPITTDDTTVFDNPFDHLATSHAGAAFYVPLPSSSSTARTAALTRDNLLTRDQQLNNQHRAARGYSTQHAQHAQHHDLARCVACGIGSNRQSCSPLCYGGVCSAVHARAHTHTHTRACTLF